jgi:sporulation protein YlmC with PRC-barrel domain
MTFQPIMAATSLIKDSVHNAQGEDLGHIKDIMIDTATQTVSYYVLSFGGVLGLGDKYFAIPPESMSLDNEHKRFVLNIAIEKLQDAEGFDKDNWPNMANSDYRSKIYNHYGVSERKIAA